MLRFLLIILSLLLIFIIFTAVFAVKYRSIYRWYHVIGKAGSGKTTTMVKLAYKYRKKGYTVYANTDIPNTYRIEDQDIGTVELKRKSVLLIDEIGLIFDNRHWDRLSNEVRDWFKLYRHRQLIIWSFSQDLDVDKKARKMFSDLFACVNYFGIYTVLKKIRRKFPVVSKDSQGESQITDEYVISPFITAPFGGRMYVFIPRWARYFNSFEAKPLPEKEFRFVSAPERIGTKKIKTRPSLINNGSRRPSGKRKHVAKRAQKRAENVR